MAEIAGKVIIITGASAGIGQASARAFGRGGARLVLAARRLDRLQALATEIEDLHPGAEVLPVAADLSRQSDRQQLVQAARNRFGRVDVLFNNAGFGRLDWLENLDPVEDIEAQLAVDVLGVIQTTRLVLPANDRPAQRSHHQHGVDGRPNCHAQPILSMQPGNSRCAASQRPSAARWRRWTSMFRRCFRAASPPSSARRLAFTARRKSPLPAGCCCPLRLSPTRLLRWCAGRAPW